MAQDLGDVIQALGRLDNAEEVLSLVYSYFRDQGFGAISYALARYDYPGRLEIAPIGFPPEWMLQYVSHDLDQHDPIPKLTDQIGQPILWSRAALTKGLRIDQRHFLAELELRVTDGLLLPTFGGGFQRGYFGIGMTSSPDILENAESNFDWWSVAQMAHIRMNQLASVEIEPVILSLREQEILAWIKKGKSNSIIAQLLEISPASVDTYVRRTFTKLGVHDRIAAVLRGVELGLI